MSFHQNNKDFIDSVGLLHEQNMAKMRLLTFMGMAVENKFLLTQCSKNFKLELKMLKHLLFMR